MKLLSFGEILWDIHGDKASLGGAPLNLAVHAAINGCEAFIASAVGKDELGRAAIEQAVSFSVNCNYLAVTEEDETGKCIVTDGEGGLPSYEIMSRAAFDCIPFTDIREEMDVVAFGTLSLRHENNRTVLGRMLDTVRHRHVFCDVNLRKPFYSKETVSYCFGKATIIKVSSEEFPEVSRLLLGDFGEIRQDAERLCGLYPNIGLFIITLGADGSLCYERKTGKWYSCGAKKVVVASTVGAGDSFSAAFLARFIGGRRIEDCLEHASRVSALVCSCDAAFSKDMASMIEAME